MSENALAVIILAAGQGTRMQSEIPKVLHPVAGTPMVEHVLHTALSMRPEKIITVLSKDSDLIQEKIHGLCEIAIQEKQLGTADAVKAALHHLEDFKGTIAILYGDTPLITRYTVEQLTNSITSETSIALLAFEDHNPTNHYGRVLANDEGEVSRIVEYKEANEVERAIPLCNSGVLTIKATLLHVLINEIDNKNSKGEFYLTDIIELAVKREHRCIYHSTDPEELIGVNNRMELSQAEELYQKRLRRAVMSQGVTLIDAETVFFSHDMKLGRDIIIHPYVVFGPNVIIEDHVEILPFSHIEGAHIGKNARIGPFSRIRPGADIDEQAHIGSFVEVKNSYIGKESKANHLSYIGDTQIGDHSNIGAGTITCNYDGKKKHKTIIGNHSFIGSNTSLVAPVTIGDNALIGAGSVITKDVAKDELAIERNQQKNIKRK